MATVSSNIILAELQKKLKGRRESNESAEISLPPRGGQSQIPQKPKRPPLVNGKSKSVSEAKKSSISTNHIQSRTKWHMDVTPGATEPDSMLLSNSSKPLPLSKSKINSRSLPKSNFLIRSTNLPPPPKNPPPVLHRDESDINKTTPSQTDTPVNANLDSPTKAAPFQNHVGTGSHLTKDEEAAAVCGGKMRLEDLSTPTGIDDTKSSLKSAKSNTDNVISTSGDVVHSPSSADSANHGTKGVNFKTETTEKVKVESTQRVNNNKSRRQGRVAVKALMKLFGPESASADETHTNTHKDGCNRKQNSDKTETNQSCHTETPPSGNIEPPSGNVDPPASPSNSSDSELTSSTEEVSQTPLIRQMSMSLKQNEHSNIRSHLAKPSVPNLGQARSSNTVTDGLSASNSTSTSTSAATNVVDLTTMNVDDASGDITELVSYENVFDENSELARFDKRTAAQKRSTPRSRKASIGKKPKPLPRRPSGSNAHLRSSSSASDTDSPRSIGGSFSTGGNFGTGGNFSPQLFFDGGENVVVDSSDLEIQNIPGKSDQSDGFGLHPLVELESEIDQLASIAQLPSLAKNSSQMMSFPAKQEVGKTMSHNPTSASNLAIRRRNTPKEQKQLRNGICSDGAAQFDSDTEDDYITMNSVSQINPMMSLNPTQLVPTVTQPSLSLQPSPQQHNKSQLHLPKSTFDPRASGYYLKIIASTLQRNGSPGGNLNSPPRDSNSTDGSPTTPRSEDDYIDMCIPKKDSENGNTGMGQESQSLPVHLMRKSHFETTAAKTSSNPSDNSQNLKINPNPVRKLKYSDVTIRSVDTATRPRHTHTPTKYQKVEVGPNGASLVSTMSSSHQPQGLPPAEGGRNSVEGSIKSRELPPLPFRVHSNASTEGDDSSIYYITTSGIGSNSIPTSISSVTIPGGATAGPGSNPLPIPGHNVVWHEYVEIDEKEIAKTSPKEIFTDSKSESSPPPQRSHAQTPLIDIAQTTPYHVRRPPPEVPDRPDNLVCRDSVVSVEYSYAAVPGKNMLGLQWLNWTSGRNPCLISTSAPITTAEQTSNVPPPQMRKQPTALNFSGGYPSPSKLSTHPPTLPPKTDSLLREQRMNSDPSVEPYLIPVFLKKNANSRKTSLPVVPTHAPKPPSILTRRLINTSNESSQSTPDLAVKSCDVQERTPDLAAKSCDVQERTPDLAAKSCDMRERAVSNRNMEEVSHTRHKKLVRQRSQSTSEVKRSKKITTHSSHSDSSEGVDSNTSRVPNPDPPYQNLPVSLLHQPEAPTPTTQAVAKRTKLHAGVQRKLDRQSLAIIMKNRTAIARQLSQKHGAGHILDANGKGKSPSGAESTKQVERDSDGKQTIIRSLGEILLELDSLLRNNICTEDDLLSAIGEQLNIPLGSSNLRSAKELASSEDLNEGVHGDSAVIGQNQLQDQPIEFTDQDVKDVVDFVSENRVESPDNENESDAGNEIGEQLFMWLPQTSGMETPECDQMDSHSHVPIPERKERSDTVIILDEENDDDSDFIPISINPSPIPHSSSNQLPIIVTEDDSNCSPLPSKLNDLEDSVIVHEDQSDRFSQSYEENRRTRITRSEAPEMDLSNGGVRDSRCFSAGQRPLRRVNAKRRPSNSNSLSTASTSFTSGSGVFTHTGGRLTNSGSGIEIVVPENAIPRGRSQKIWFDVVQTVLDPREISGSGSDSRSLGDTDILDGKRNRKVQLSPMVLVGPCDAVFQRPIKIKLPHCLPYRNNAWHLHMLARAQNSDNDDWTELPNTFGLVPPRKRKQSSKFFHTAFYQMHLDYAQVRTCQLGCFKLVGNPIRNGSHSAKRMVVSAYVKGEGCEGGEGGDGKSVSIVVFITNAILDHAKALNMSLAGNGFQCLERNIPILCFGDGRDMELTLWSCDSNTTTPLATKDIPFGQIWRQKKVGQSHVKFEVDSNILQGSRTLALRMQQAGAKIFHETNFIVP